MCNTSCVDYGNVTNLRFSDISVQPEKHFPGADL